MRVSVRRAEWWPVYEIVPDDDAYVEIEIDPELKQRCDANMREFDALQILLRQLYMAADAE